MFLTLSCEEEIVQPQSRIPSIQVHVQSVSSVEATLTISLTDTMMPRSYLLKRNGIQQTQGSFTSAKATVYDSTLRRGQHYSYRAYRVSENNVVTDSSELLTIQTLDSASVKLKIEDIGVTDAVVEVMMNDKNPARTIRLSRDGKQVFLGNILGRDTVILDQGLAVKKSYTYTAERYSTALPVDTSLSTTITTLDTTSHNITWVIDTLGSESSFLKDIAIIDDNLTIAVGKLHRRNDKGLLQEYNLAKYDGALWKLDTASFIYLNAIFSFNSKDYWLGGCGPCHWDGMKLKGYYVTGIFNGCVNKFWGLSSNDIYAVGNNGTLAQFNGKQWSAIASQTTTNITDISGSSDGNNIWACGYQDFKPTVLLKCENSVWTKVIEDDQHLFYYDANEISGGMKGVWTMSKHRVFVLTWFDLYMMMSNSKRKATAIWKGTNPYDWADGAVRGTGMNNIFVVGYPGRIWHFNGKTWKTYQLPNTSYDILWSVSVKNNHIVIVGVRNYNGIEYYGVVYRGVME
ncbi:MAG: hypothetical protein HYZ34_12260 [Ignavibacteriae bacterium]|nr:hypothetical protein [Ignavibacteriota bacterium]